MSRRPKGLREGTLLGLEAGDGEERENGESVSRLMARASWNEVVRQ